MNLAVTFKNIRAREEIRKRADALYEKLERFLDPAAEGQLVVQVDHGNAVMELVVSTFGETHTANEEDEDLRAALDKVFHTMEVRLRRSKEKRVERGRGTGERPDGFVAEQ